jgi:protein-tyrosine phosphatase
MKYGILFSSVAALLVFSAVLRGGWMLLLWWPAVSFGAVAAGYFCWGPRVFGKSPRGLLSLASQLVLLPYLVLLWSAWRLLRLVKRERAFDELTDRVLIGRRLLSHELPANIQHVIDLTCEFNEPRALRTTDYHSFQVLDGFVPSADQLWQWASQIAAMPGRVYIHCAEGHGRTGLLAAALLRYTGQHETSEEALRFIKSKRPLVRLGRRQRRALRALDEREPPGN